MSPHITIDRAHQLSELIKQAISTSVLVANQNVQYQIEQEQVVLTGIVNRWTSQHSVQTEVTQKRK